MTLSITRYPCADNYQKGRRDPSTGVLWDVDQAVIHVTMGGHEGTRSWFNYRKSDVSATYNVLTNGLVDQFVDEKDTAFAQGIVDRPVAPLVRARPGVNPNFYSISIEHEGDGTKPLTSKQRDASAELLASLPSRWPKLKLTKDHVVPHNWIRASKACPGRISVTELLTIANGATTPEPFVPLVWSHAVGDYLAVVRVVSDTEWYYAPLKPLLTSARENRAVTPLSAMPRHP